MENVDKAVLDCTAAIASLRQITYDAYIMGFLDNTRLEHVKKSMDSILRNSQDGLKSSFGDVSNEMAPIFEMIEKKNYHVAYEFSLRLSERDYFPNSRQQKVL
ncbi:MAG: hypothetical protein Q8P15_03315 [Nanoarchaeota archaeon]|nr:hypothetical protein [Nanoarchaeota archaeon]